MEEAHTFGVLQVWVTVNARVAHIAIASVENVGKLTCLQWAGHSTDEDGLPSINWLCVVHDEVTVTESPRSDLDLWSTRLTVKCQSLHNACDKFNHKILICIDRGSPHRSL